MDADEFFVSESKAHGTSPYSAEFPTAQYASNFEGTFAGASSNSWVYNSVYDTAMVTHGTGTKANAASSEITVIISFTPAWVQYSLPISYGNKHHYSGTQTIKTTAPIPGFGNFTNTITQGYTTRQHVDGYGVFTLPGGKQYEGIRILEYTEFNLNGEISKELAIRILSKTGESVHITPSNYSDSTGVVAIDEISWTSGDGSGELAKRPEPPTELIATAKTDKIELIWTDNSDNETGFYIERSTNGGGFVRIDSTLAGVTNYADMNVTPGDVYVYRTFAYNNSGVSTSTLTASASIVVTVTVPGNLTVNISQTSIGITWIDNSNNEIGFYIERKGSGTKSANDEFVVIDSVGANVTGYTDLNVEPGVEYTYRVRAYNEFALSEYSNEMMAKIEITVNAPLQLTANANSGKIDLGWNDNSDNEEKFYIERAANGGNFTLLDSVAANVITYSDGNATPGVEYSYRVRTSVSGVNSDYTNTTSSRIIPTSNFDFTAENNSLKLHQNFPNPFSGSTRIVFEIAEKGHVELSVFDSNGKQVGQLLNSKIEKGKYTVLFDSKGLENGIYFYQLKTSEGVAKSRMQIIK